MTSLYATTSRLINERPHALLTAGQLRFEVVADPEGNVSVLSAWPCDRAEVRDLCIKVANACNSGDRDVTFRAPAATR